MHEKDKERFTKQERECNVEDCPGKNLIFVRPVTNFFYCSEWYLFYFIFVNSDSEQKLPFFSFFQILVS